MEGGASTAGGMGESVNGARETGGMEMPHCGESSFEGLDAVLMVMAQVTAA